jgi:hypothetical protein
VPYGQLDQSLVATSEKVTFNNRSQLNVQPPNNEAKGQKTWAEDESQNEFLDVGKWKKSKESVLSREMATVQQEVQEGITQTRWKKKAPEPPQEEEVIADESQVPDEEDKDEKEEEEIEDQTMQEEE